MPEPEPYVREDVMEQYIETCVSKHKPIVALCQNHLDYILEVLLIQHGIYDPIVEKKENDIVCCKHYPFTCDEIDEFDKDAHKEHLWDPELCKCRGMCACDNSNVPERHYWEFSWDDKFMKHHDNCYDGCCSYSKVFLRYIIKYE